MDVIECVLAIKPNFVHTACTINTSLNTGRISQKKYHFELDTGINSKMGSIFWFLGIIFFLNGMLRCMANANVHYYDFVVSFHYSYILYVFVCACVISVLSCMVELACWIFPGLRLVRIVKNIEIFLVLSS